MAINVNGKETIATLSVSAARGTFGGDGMVPNIDSRPFDVRRVDGNTATDGSMAKQRRRVELQQNL